MTPGDLDQPCPSDVTKIVLDWILDAETGNRITECAKSCLKQTPSLEFVEVIQVSPSNRVVNLINSVEGSLGEGTHRHGAIISGLLDILGLFNAHESVTIDLMPSQLDLRGVCRTDFITQAADVFGDCFESQEFGQRPEPGEAAGSETAPGDVMGFDCVVVTIDVKKLALE